MNYRLIWSPDAEDDLHKIYSYYSERSQKAANNILSDINTKVNILLNQPYIAAIEQLLTEFPQSFRSLVAYKGKFKVLYYVDDKDINIIAIWNCKQNPEKMKNRLNT